MKTIKSCAFNIDTACVDVVCENGGTLSIYTPMIEESLRTTVHSRSKLDWLIENEPMEYARMVLDGTMQKYLDGIDGDTQQQMKNFTERLAERFPKNIAEDIARELMMYNS
jgi:predicted lipase